MGRRGRWIVLIVTAVVTAGAVAWPLACARRHDSPPVPSPPQAADPSVPIVRVRLLAAQERVTLRANVPPTIKTASEVGPLRVNATPGAPVALVLTPEGWRLGGVDVPGRGELTLWQGEDATVSINDRAYRGNYRFVPTGGNTFDVVNDVDIDSYLKGVLARELLRGWNEETYRAQAIVARTYALYESRVRSGAGVAGGRGSQGHWDLYPDQRSQVYGGVKDETARSRAAADDTAGVVVAYGPAGEERIFKTYFSACCGGVSQSAADAFGEAYLVPLSDQDVKGLCSVSPRYNWGPVEISKAELTRRLRLYGTRRDRGEKNLAAIETLEIQSLNRFNRPIRFVVTDVDGTRYSLSGEELRNAINGGASKETPEKLYSSFFKTVSDPSSDVIRFVEGHGHGHGVGMCQYCSQARAEAGMRHEDIVLSAFPRAKLVRAY